MTDALLILNVNVEISHHYDASNASYAFLSSAELPGFHIALHDVDAVSLIEGHARNLVETHYVVLSDQTPLASAVVDEHPRHRRLPT